MKCLHPHCPMGSGATDWAAAVDASAAVKIKSELAPLLAGLAPFGALASPPIALPPPVSNASLLVRLLRACPCLFNQLAVQATAEAVVHLCEVTLGARISTANIDQTYLVQHPKLAGFKFPPLVECGDGGAVMEMLCSEYLEVSGMPRMDEDAMRWPVWTMPGHMLLNQGKMRSLKAFGDILIPCAPTNIIVSVKTAAARERLLYSANSIEGVGFGFFTQADEFWTDSRMRLYKRMGFSAIYMPTNTHAAVMARIAADKTEALSVNINGTPLYRPLTQFGGDMRRIVGRSTFDL